MDFGPVAACTWGPSEWHGESFLLYLCGAYACWSLLVWMLTRLNVARGMKIFLAEPPPAGFWVAALAISITLERLLGDLWDVGTQRALYTPFNPDFWTEALAVCGLAIAAHLAWRLSWPAMEHAVAVLPKDPRPLRLSL